MGLLSHGIDHNSFIQMSYTKATFVYYSKNSIQAFVYNIACLKKIVQASKSIQAEVR